MVKLLFFSHVEAHLEIVFVILIMRTADEIITDTK